MLAIGIENFQSVRERQDIPLSGLTLIYGNNSSGKSIIKDALEVAQGLKEDQSIQVEWINHHALESGEPIRLSYSFPARFGAGLSSDVGNIHENILRPEVFEFIKVHNDDHELVLLNDYLFNSIIKVTYEWSEREVWDSTNLSRISIEMGSSIDELEGLKLLAETTYVEGVFGEQILLEMNKEHELFKMLENRLKHSPFLSGLEPSQFYLGTGVFDLHPVLDRYRWSQASDDAMYENDLGFLLVYFCTISVSDFVSTAYRSEFVGGVRESSEIKEKDTYSGASFWHYLKSRVLHEHLGLESCSDDLDRINKWLSSKSYLDSGYTLSADFKFLVNISELVSKEYNARNLMVNLSNEGQLQYSKLMLKDVHTGSLLDFSDVGTGISQVLPILYHLANSRPSGYFAYVQQPELHLHPKLQASVGQVFAESFITNGKARRYIVETHSELIILRLLKIIRNSYRAENLLKKCVLLAEDVNVIFAVKDGGITTYKSLRISKNGDFLDKWPEGFFEERDQELF